MRSERNPLLAELKEPHDVLSQLLPEESELLLGMLRKAKATQPQAWTGPSMTRSRFCRGSFGLPRARSS